MCGITGYIGTLVNSRVLEALLLGLKRLEYRGYDSAGLVIYSEHTGCVMVKKVTGKDGMAISQLEEEARKHPIVGSAGIAHTRWKTHGAISEKNTHPHVDCRSEIFVVHNGTVENYRELRDELIELGHIFSSETDTEVIAHMIEQEFEHDEVTLEKAVLNTILRLRGQAALLILHKKYPDKLIAVCQSPGALFIGEGNESHYIASSKNALIGMATSVISIRNGEMAVVTAGSVEVTSFSDQKKALKKKEQLSGNVANLGKRGYQHYMLKEINEEPEAMRNLLAGRLNEADGIAVLGGESLDVLERIKSLSHIYIVACGTSNFAGEVGAMCLRELAAYRTTVLVPEEFVGGHYPCDPKQDAVIVISQSGETADTIKAMREAKLRGLIVFGIINQDDSFIAENDDAGIFTRSGDERAVPSTKVYVAQVAALQLLALSLGRARGTISQLQGIEMVKAMELLPDQITEVSAVNLNIMFGAKKLRYDLMECATNSILVLGRGPDAISAKECALKIKEICYVHAEAVQSAEMKHGSIAMIQKKYPVIVIANKSPDMEKTYTTLEEVRASGATTFVIGDAKDAELRRLADFLIPVPQPALRCLAPIVTAPAIHLLAYWLAIELKNNGEPDIDPDRPRNLAKSVTV